MMNFCWFVAWIVVVELSVLSLAFAPLSTYSRIATAHQESSCALYNALSGEEIYQRLQDQLAKLRQRDRTSKAIKPEDLKVVYEDDHIFVVDKPSGILCVQSEEGIPSLAQAVYERFRNNSPPDVSIRGKDAVKSMDQIVVHRLGMDTSGLVVFTKTMKALRGMNTLFRTRQVTKQYEALVCGWITQIDAANNDGEEFGWITFPLMSDYECPPFMRVSTMENQRVLIDLDPLVVGKRLLQAPKSSLTKYEVVARERLSADGSVSICDNDDDNDASLPVTRLTLTAITGRTHQLNVHLAAFGHPIVGDRIYGIGGDALPNGGLEIARIEEQNPYRASEDLQEQIAAVVSANNINMCVHAKFLKFRHPITGEDISFTSDVPF